MNIYKATDLIQRLPLIDAFLTYVYTRDVLDGRKWDSWQIFDGIMMLKERRICLNRARGGSKTLDSADFLAFLALRNNETFWIAATNYQLKNCKKYWNANSFIISFNPNSTRNYCLTILYQTIEFVCATDGNIRGPRKNVIVFDEMAQIKWTLFENTLGIYNGMDDVGDGIFMIMISTPILGSTFHKVSVIYVTITRRWYWMSWFKVNSVNEAKRVMTASKFAQEFMCDFISLEGVIFENNINIGICPYELETNVYYGSDPNPREGYCVVGIQYAINHNAIAIVYVKNFGGGNAGKLAMLKFLLEKSKLHTTSIEIEENGVGGPIVDEFLAMTDNFISKFWKAQDKVEVVNDIVRHEIWIPTDQQYSDAREKKWMRETRDQISNLSWSKDGNQVDKPSDKTWHFNDSFLHACHKNLMVGIEAY